MDTDAWIALLAEVAATAATVFVAPELTPFVDSALSSALPEGIISDYLVSAATESGLTSQLTQHAVSGTARALATQSLKQISPRSTPAAPATMSDPTKTTEKAELIAATPLTDGDRIPRPVHRKGFLGQGRRISMPFSTILTDHQGRGSYHAVIAAKLGSIMGPFRFAQLTQLEYVVLPNKQSGAHKWHLSAAWTVATVPNITEDSHLFEHPASTRVVYTTGATSIAPSVFPCPLGALNPIIRDSVPYVDTPKIHVYFDPDDSGDRIHLCTALIRGVVELGDIAAY